MQSAACLVNIPLELVQIYKGAAELGATQQIRLRRRATLPQIGAKTYLLHFVTYGIMDPSSTVNSQSTIAFEKLLL